jgi:hypothetical protein
MGRVLLVEDQALAPIPLIVLIVFPFNGGVEMPSTQRHGGGPTIVERRVLRGVAGLCRG